MTNMAARTAVSKLLRNANKTAQFTPLVRTYWNKDWQPGQYPKTEAERAAAAKKYGLIPEDYKPFPISDTGINYGDYPQLENVSAECRDPYEAYDFPELRRNFGEPVS
ncbi:hypothetical protein CHUAL_005376 [Chamberlinius hualienensis]